MISDKRVEQAITYLVDTDSECASLKAGMERAEFKAKALRDAIFLRLDGTVAERQATAGASPEYAEAAMNAYFDLVAKYEGVRNKRGTEGIVVELYRTIQAKALLLPAAAAQDAQAPKASPIPVEDFFRKARFAQVSLSPSGRYIAAIVLHERRNIAIIDLNDTTKVSVITAFKESDVRSIAWVNDDRLVYTLIDLQRPVADQLGAGLFAVNRDATEYRELSPVEMRDNALGRPRGDRALSYVSRSASLYSTFRPTQGSDIIITSTERNPRFPDLFRMDTKTGRKTLITESRPGDVVECAARLAPSA